MRRAALTLVFAFALTGVAHAHLFLSADASVDRGYIKLYSVGSSDLGPVGLFEGAAPLGTLTLSQPIGDDPQLGPLSAGSLPRATRWRCDRLDRSFAASATAPDGTVDRATFAVRTPSCRNRLTLAAPARVEPGHLTTVTVTDTWGTDDDPAVVCTRKPGGTAECAPLRFAGGVATHVFTPHARTRYLVTLRAPAQRLDRHVAVGVKALPEPVTSGPTILSTGDSMMQSVDAILGDRLANRAEVVGDVKIGAAISSDMIVDWPALARQQVAAQHPQATVVFLGTNDRYPIDGIACCGPDWSAKYVLRVRGIMRTYAQHGRGSVIWLTVPAAQDPRRAEGQRTVNAALVEAAAGLPTVSVLDMARLFTPGGTYRATMVVDGKRVRVRDHDGLHLSIPGARIAARAIIGRLEAAGIL